MSMDGFPTIFNQTPNAGDFYGAVRLWGLSSIVEKETALTTI